MTNVSKTLYTGVTNNLERRVWEHKQKVVPGFTSRYNINRLVWFDQTPDITAAIAYEKQIKGWKRWKKIRLIEEMNPTWADLSADWYEPEPAMSPSLSHLSQGRGSEAAPPLKNDTLLSC